MQRFWLVLTGLACSAMTGCMTFVFGTHAKVGVELVPREATAQVFEAKWVETEPWRTDKGEFLARRWRLEPVNLVDEIRGEGTLRLRRGPAYLIKVDFDSGYRMGRAVCPRLADRWWLGALLGLGVGGLIDWASGAIWYYEDGHWISRNHDSPLPPFCYRRLPLMERIELMTH